MSTKSSPVSASLRFIFRIEIAASSSFRYVERLRETAIGFPPSVPRATIGPCTVRSTMMSGTWLRIAGGASAALRRVRRSISRHFPLYS